jgi:hypothetical protein
MSGQQALELTIAVITTGWLIHHVVQGLRRGVFTMQNRFGRFSTIARDSTPFAYWLTAFMLVLMVLSIWTCVIFDCLP